MSRDLLPDSLQTKRLRLRQPFGEDAACIFDAYGQDSEVSRYMVWRPLKQLSEAEQFIGQAIADWDAGHRYAYILELSGTDCGPIGMLDARIAAHTIDFGYVLARPYWGKGYMPEALQVISDAALSSPSIYRLQGTCDVDNRASARILEKCGYVLEGRLERYVVHPNISAEPRPCLMYARCK